MIDALRPKESIEERGAYRQKSVIECARGRLKFRRIATRYERLASIYLALLTLAALFLAFDESSFSTELAVVDGGIV